MVFIIFQLYSDYNIVLSPPICLQTTCNKIHISSYNFNDVSNLYATTARCCYETISHSQPWGFTCKSRKNGCTSMEYYSIVICLHLVINYFPQCIFYSATKPSDHNRPVHSLQNYKVLLQIVGSAIFYFKNAHFVTEIKSLISTIL